MTVQAWAAAPEAPADVESDGSIPPLCEDPTCIDCRVSEVGAKALAAAAGLDWDALEAHARDHYAAIAAAMYTAMGDEFQKRDEA